MFDEEEDEGSTPEVLKRFIEQYKSHIEDTKYYIEDRNWGRKTSEESFGDLKKEHSIEWSLMRNMSERLKYFVKEAENYLHRKFARDFITTLKSLLEGYIERSNVYMKMNKWTEIENPDYMDSQITFQDDLLKNINDLRKIMGAINLDDAKEESKKIPIHGDKIIPFLMKEIIEARYPKQFAK